MTVSTLLALALLASDAPKTTAAPSNSTAVSRGLKWLADHQTADGHWIGLNDGYVSLVTGYAGVALLMEGSTLTQGRYAPHLRKAVAWIEKNAGADGRLGGTLPSEAGLEILSHSSAALFLACVYDVDDDEPRRARLGKLIKKSIEFVTTEQTANGGWSYINSRQNNADDNYTTVAMLQVLLATRKAGFDVPRRLTERAVQYLVKATNRSGGVKYSVTAPDSDTAGATDPVLAASAAAVLLMSEGARPDTLPRWVTSARDNASPVMQNLATNPVAMFQQYYMARIAYGLGDEGHRRIDSVAKAAALVKWSDYKKAAFKPLMEAQAKDGSCPDVYFGRAHSTAVALIVLQLDNGYLPAFSR